MRLPRAGREEGCGEGERREAATTFELPRAGREEGGGEGRLARAPTPRRGEARRRGPAAGATRTRLALASGGGLP